MAQDEQLIEADHASRSRGAPKALGVLAAVSAGGLMALRMKPAPLMFLAGAAAVALLSRKRVLPASRPLELLPERPPEPPAPPRVEVDAWLARQIEREQQSPVITLDVETLPETKPPTPEPLETAQAALKPEIPPELPQVPFFAESIFSTPAAPAEPQPLFEAQRPAPMPPASLWDAPLASPSPVFPPLEPVETPPEHPREAEPDGGGFLLPSEPAQPLYPPPSAGTANASWLLGIEPLPSWDELAAQPSSQSSSDQAFLEEPPGTASYTPQPAPVGPKAPEQPFFIPSLFQGGALPDEITVADEPPGPTPEEPPPTVPPASLTTEAVEMEPAPSLWPSVEIPPSVFTPPANEPPPLAAPAQLPELIPVSLAAPGEATFDDPLAALEENPSSLPGGLPPPPPLRPHAPVVEAEIIVRPRGIGFSKIQAKQAAEESPEPAQEAPTPSEAPEPAPFPLSDLSPHPENAAPASSGAPPAIPPAPVVLPREQKARKTWRSWWRGD